MKESEGVLPRPGWLQSNGYYGLYHAIRQYPELFAHLKQDCSRATDEEAVALAEKLARKNKGMIPSSARLRENGYGGLRQRMQHRPELFAHLTQDRLQATDEKAVALAEALADKNKGKIPSAGWLQRNGYARLDSRIRDKPELFTHLKQDRYRATDDETVALAEKLARKNGGKIPNVRWLIKNGHKGLDHRMRNKPQLFTHLEQTRLNPQGQAI